MLVDELKLNVLPSTLTVVSGALPNFSVTLVVPLGNVSECDVEDDNVPCHNVELLAVTDIHALLEADRLNFGLEEAFFISQVDPDVVELNFLKVAVDVFLEEDFLEDDEALLLLLLFVLLDVLPETLTELLSTLSLVVLLPL